MGYYSFTAIATHTVSLKNPYILLGPGLNVFTAVTDDLEGLKALLESEGVDIKSVNRLDGLEPVPPESLLLPGEDPRVLVPLLGDHGKKNS